MYMFIRISQCFPHNEANKLTLRLILLSFSILRNTAMLSQRGGLGVKFYFLVVFFTVRTELS